ncbi:MAG: hypothetical protein ABIB71_06380 [Candidatus Woesearchaeota archaeon]
MGALALNKTVDDFLSGYSKLGTPDEKIEHKVEGSLLFDGFEELVKQYERILAIGENGFICISELLGAFSQIMSVLQSEQINSFLQATKRYEDREEYSNYTGRFITKLIENSHDAGNNKFTLNTRDLKEIDCIGFCLKVRRKKLLEIIIDGNVGDACFERAKNIGRIHISGNAGAYCACEAENIREIYICGEARRGCGDRAENSKFKTPNKETLQLLKEKVPKYMGNKIYFIHQNKHEEEIEWQQ